MRLFATIVVLLTALFGFPYITGGSPLETLPALTTEFVKTFLFIASISSALLAYWRAKKDLLFSFFLVGTLVFFVLAALIPGMPVDASSGLLMAVYAMAAVGGAAFALTLYWVLDPLCR